MLTGPQNMPKFSDRQLTPEEKKDIIAYVKSVSGDYNNNPGGNPLGGIGPVSEGLIAFIVGIAAMIGFATVAGSEDIDHARSTRPGQPAPTPTPSSRACRQDELARLAAELDDVDVVHNQRKWPIPGTRAEKRAERAVAPGSRISALSGLAFLVRLPVLALPVRGPAGRRRARRLLALHPGRRAHLRAVGARAGHRRDRATSRSSSRTRCRSSSATTAPSAEVARKTVVGPAGQGRRGHRHRPPLADHALGAAPPPASSASGSASPRSAPLVRNPWKGGDEAALWTTGWRRPTARPSTCAATPAIPDEVSLVRPEDLEPGSMETVFPFRESERGDEEALLHGAAPVRQPGDADPAAPGHRRSSSAPGQEDFHYGDFYAYSKICTHLGCPTSLYETQTNRILCPCHQSQFIATEYAKPVFGPAARPLPQLPITVNEEGYFVATGDFLEAVGPAFWESEQTHELDHHADHLQRSAARPRSAEALDELDQRYHPAAGLRKQFNKVFPTHWSFMLGEVALYSFIVLLLSGTYLALFFDPSMAEVALRGPVREPARRAHGPGVRERAGDLLRGPRRAVRPAGAPLGGAAVHGRDGRAHVPRSSSPARSASRARPTGSSASC